MTIKEAIGQNIRRHRQVLQLSQEALGAQLEAFLGKPWKRQAVHSAEQGRRDFRAVDLLAFCMALEVTPSVLMLPGGTVNLPSGRTLEAPYDFGNWLGSEPGLMAEAAEREGSLVEQLAEQQVSLLKALRKAEEVSRHAAEYLEQQHGSEDK
jgi:hypothetical protein